jgi:hypothetical protein
MDGQTVLTRLLELVEEENWRGGTEWRRSGDGIDVEAGGYKVTIKWKNPRRKESLRRTMN